ncbi:MAG TPA: FecR domain-containing protein [Kofleriaceae bacterium]|jgi:ferric-dicitrate binding protein FerR (iron transport regulator)
MSDDYLFDKSGSDDEVADLEHQLGAFAHRAPLRDLPPLPRRPWRRRAAIASVALAAAAGIAMYLRRPTAPPGASACGGGSGMAFTVQSGTTRCGGEVAKTGTLPVGTWLETAHDSQASVAIAKIGTVTVYPDSRVQLVGTGATEHRLALASGHISAKVSAPPRLFVIETPTSTAVDLGCAYDLVVDSVGSHLTVTFGAVSLEGKPFGAYVPRGTTVVSRPGHGVGVPVATNASREMRDAVARFEDGDTSAARVIATQATMHDIVTLWHLIPRTLGPERAQIVGALERLVPVPLDYEAADMIAGNQAAIDEWRESVMWQWLLDN